MEAFLKKMPKPLIVSLFSIILCVWVYLTIIGAQFIVMYPMLWLAGKEFILSAVGETIYSVLVYTVAFALIVIIPALCFKKLKTNREELGLIGLPTWTDIGLAPIAFVASLIIASALTATFSLIFPNFDMTQAQNVGFSNLAGSLDRIVAFFTLVILAPILEECIFRGWLYGKLRSIISAPIAILLVSLVFGIAHGQWNVGITTFAMSIIMCFLREITGTTYSGILMHMIKNGVAFYLLFLV